MNKIMIGPFFSTAPQTRVACHSVANLGVQMEWASSTKAMQVQLFKPRLQSGRLRLEHLLFASRKLGFDVSCAGHQIVKTENGVFLPLEALLISLYETHEVSRNIQQVLADLASVAPLEGRVSRLLWKPGYLVAKVEAHGFILNTVIAQGNQIYAEIAWRPATGPSRFHTCICCFRLSQDASLSAGTWLPAGTVTVGTLLA